MPNPTTEPSEAERFVNCNAEGCSASALSSGFCSTHEVQCIVKGCTKKQKTWCRRRCRKHDYGRCTAEFCTNAAVTKERKLCEEHDNGECSVQLHGRCSEELCNNKQVIGGRCLRHFYGECSVDSCTNVAQHKSGRCDRHEFGECSVDSCTNVAISRERGLCSKHDGKDNHAKRVRCSYRQDGLRCCLQQLEGGAGFCIIHGCTTTVKPSEVDDESPSTIIYKHIEGRMDYLKTKLSKLNFETLKMLYGIIEKLVYEPMQGEGYYPLEIIDNFVVEHLMDITDEKYDEEIMDGARNESTTLGVYVKDKIERSLKCGVRDWLIRYDYKGKVLLNKVRQLLKAIDAVFEAYGYKKAAKGGTGPAATRCKDDYLYPHQVYERSTIVQLDVEVSSEERAPMERIAITYLVLTTGGNCSNVQLVIEDNPFHGGVYIIFSKFETIADHFTAYGIQNRGFKVPEGKMLVDIPINTTENDDIDSNNIETVAASPTAASGGGGVVDDAVLTTAANTSVTAGENTNAQFCGECTVQPSELATATPTEKQKTSTTSSASNTSQDESSPEKTHGPDDLKRAARPISGVPSPTVQVQTPQDHVEFNSTQYDDDRDSPPNVSGFPYESTLHQQRDGNGKDLRGFESQHVARQGVGNCDYNQLSSIDRKRGHSLQSNADGPSPKMHRPIVSRQQLSDPPENAQAYKAMAEACVLNRQLARDDYVARLSRRLIDHWDVSFGEAMAAKSEIQFMADSRVSGSAFEEVEQSLSQPDSNVIYYDTILKKRSEKLDKGD